ncbi:hypothetical protein [Aeromonas caviae]|uniref:hypothetical protein n=1 Tax=Aeromonas caviae TaxID=648 RepID=UPI00224F22F7|nr:hypothetical protein [Aeromonas caviae]MCX4071094.1 hypothetical protein [Aeromonas caviae]
MMFSVLEKVRLIRSGTIVLTYFLLLTVHNFGVFGYVNFLFAFFGFSHSANSPFQSCGWFGQSPWVTPYHPENWNHEKRKPTSTENILIIEQGGDEYLPIILTLMKSSDEAAI